MKLREGGQAAEEGTVGELRIPGWTPTNGRANEPVGVRVPKMTPCLTGKSDS